jgi:hypothetical protein
MKLGTSIALFACLFASLALTPRPAAAADPVVAAAGDIACAPGDSKDPCQDAETANLLAGVSAVLPLGDNQYEAGSLFEYQNAYDHTWGAYKPLTHPVAGNHEWVTASAQGYKDYFGAIANPDGDQNTYYSWDLGNWHFVALDSDCGNLPPAPGTTNGCGSGSPEEVWLKNDLASNQAQCEIAYWHHPKFTSFPGVNSKVKTFWKDLQNDKAELILNGHSHAYERFAAQLPDGTASPSGIVEIIAGTGGHSHMVQKTVKPNSVVRNNTDFGVLKLTLHAASYDFQFVDTTGAVLDESPSSVACH